MPPFLRLVPPPRKLTELAETLAIGIGLSEELPAVAVRVGQQVLTQAVVAGVDLLGRGVDLGNALLASPLLGSNGPGSDDADDGDEPFPTYTGLDTSAWGAGDDEPETAAPHDEAAEHEPETAAPHDEAAEHEPPITLSPELAAAARDRAEPPATDPARQDLPVDGYDGLSVTALRSRVAGLSKPELETVRDYEAGHAKRVTVLAMLERQIAKA